MNDRELEAIAAYLHTCKVSMTAADPQQPDCPIIASNAAFHELTGYSPSQIEGRNCRFLQGDFVDERERKQIRKAIQHTRSHLGILLNFKKNGDPFHNLLILEPMRLSSGKTIILGCQFAFELQAETEAISQEVGLRCEHIDHVMRKTGIASAESFKSLRLSAASAVASVRHYAFRHRMIG